MTHGLCSSSPETARIIRLIEVITVFRVPECLPSDRRTNQFDSRPVQTMVYHPQVLWRGSIDVEDSLAQTCSKIRLSM